MDSIQSIVSGIMSSVNKGAKPSSSTSSASSGNAAGVYGAAFEISISETKFSDGSEKDTVSFASYGGNASGNSYASGANGSGGDLESAFEAMMASLSGTSALGGDDESEKAAEQGLSDVFHKMADALNNTDGNATASTAGGGLLSEVGAPFKNPSGVSSAMNDFMNEIIQSLQDSLTKSGEAHKISIAKYTDNTLTSQTQNQTQATA